MSYDIWLEIDTGGDEPARLDDEHWNYTSNCAAMWRRAIPDTDGLAGLEGMDAGAAAVALTAGIALMEADPRPYRAMNPGNGWGDFDSQLDALRRLKAWCERHPKAKVAVWR